MKNVTIFGINYKVTENIYNVLKSVKGNDECIGAVLFLGKETGEIILN